MILPIVQYGHPVLRERCQPVEKVDDKLRELVDAMLETMYDANGVGLAAPQIGVPIRLAVIDVSHDPKCVSFLRVNGEDVEPGAAERSDYGMKCRLYPTTTGHSHAPPQAWIRHALERRP